MILMEIWVFGVWDFYFDGIWGFSGPRYRTEIVKLKELPNDGFETSKGALWLGIVTSFVSKFGEYGAPVALPKS